MSVCICECIYVYMYACVQVWMYLCKYVYMVPLSGISSGILANIKETHENDYCIVLNRIFNNFNGIDIQNGNNITIIDFSIRGDTINFFVKILNKYFNRTEKILTPKFINIMDTYRYSGSQGPEIKNINGKIIMQNNSLRPLFSSILKLHDVRCIGYIISDNMEYFTMNGVPRIIPEFRFYNWHKLQDSLINDNLYCIEKTKNFINKLYSYYNCDEGSHFFDSLNISELIKENQSTSKYVNI